MIVSAGTFWSLYRAYQNRRAFQSGASEKLASAEGWKISRFNGNKKIYDASIERFSVERAKMGPFAIGPLHVAHLKNVVVDFYAEGLYPVAEANKDPSQRCTFIANSMKASLIDIKNEPVFRSRKIKILDIEGISLNLWEKDKRVFRISGDQATVDRQTGDIIFAGHASLDADGNGSVISHRIRWVKKTSLFRINDPYIMTQGKSKKEGRVLETDYLLKSVKYEIKN